MTQEIRIYPQADIMQSAAIAFLTGEVLRSVAARGRCSLVLSGGSTPEPVYAGLGDPSVAKNIPWESVHFFWGDERHVPPDHPESNYRMVRDTLLARVSIPEENVHRVPAEMDPRMAAFRYEEDLRSFYPGDWPRFDIVLLGIGTDGHTASLFPHTAGLQEEQRWFIANQVSALDAWRLTLSKNAINAARLTLVLAAGEAKSDAVATALEGPHQPEITPIQLISPEDGRMLWFLDQRAAAELKKGRG